MLGQFQLEPVNVTKLRGSDALFTTTVQGKWPFMTWTVGGVWVLTMPSVGNASSSSEQFSARFCSSGNSCVDFTIHNVTRKDSGPVTCNVQDYSSKSSQLYVQGTSINISHMHYILWLLRYIKTICAGLKKKSEGSFVKFQKETINQQRAIQCS